MSLKFKKLHFKIYLLLGAVSVSGIFSDLHV